MGTARPAQPPLKDDITCDVLVIGGGAAGLAAAARLIEGGKKVVLLERSICGGGSTGKSAGFLTPDSELELSQLLRRFGTQGAGDLWNVPVRGISRMLELIRDSGADCDLQKQDSIFLGKGQGGAKAVIEEVVARKKLGYESRVYKGGDLSAILGSKLYSAGIRYQDTYGIDGLRYAQGIKGRLLDRGVGIYESSAVVGFSDHKAKTHMGSVTADSVIFCADKLGRDLSPYSWNVYHEQTFLSITEPLSQEEQRSMFPEAPLQCWDSDLIYSYYRLTGSKRLLLGGGSVMTTYAKNDTTDSRVIDHVIAGFRKAFPGLAKLRFAQFWMGRIDMTRDLLPTVLKEPRAPWVHRVFGCVGLPWATFCGDFAARQVLSQTETGDEKYYGYFDVDRKFLVPIWAERLMGKRLAFPINNAWAKYYQRDVASQKSPVPPK